MCTHYLRLIGWLVIVSVFTLLITIFLGYHIPTDTVIEYRILDGATYPMLIRVSDRTFSLILAGAQCFHSSPVKPERLATRYQYQPTYSPEAIKLHDAQFNDALNRIPCEHLERLRISATARAWQLLP
jgi:hypothetical protein